MNGWLVSLASAPSFERRVMGDDSDEDDDDKTIDGINACSSLWTRFKRGEINNRKNLGQIQCGIMIRDLRLSQYHNATRGGGIIIHHCC